MKLIDTWRQWPRMYSQWAALTIVALQTTVLAVISTETLAAPILFYPSMTWGTLASSVTAFLAVSGFVGRLLDQGIGETPAG